MMSFMSCLCMQPLHTGYCASLYLFILKFPALKLLSFQRISWWRSISTFLPPDSRQNIPISRCHGNRMHALDLSVRGSGGIGKILNGSILLHWVLGGRNLRDLRLYT